MKEFLKKYLWILAALFCTMLWGLASPTIKLGYQLFPVDTSDAFNIILFAGIRFVGAGIIALLLTKVFTKESPKFDKSMIGPIAILAIFQTAGQYTCFYLGLAVVDAAVGSVLTATSVFFTVILVTIVFRTETLTAIKIIATILGLLGSIVLNIDHNLTLQFRFYGEGLILLSSLMNAFANFFMSRFGKKHNLMAITGYQFFVGGLVMVVIAIIKKGSIGIPNINGMMVMLVLMLIASLAYGIWSLLLKIKDTSHVVIFKSFTPVFGAFFSWVLLSEDIFNIRLLISLALITLGTLLINYIPKNSNKNKKDYKPI